MAVDTFDGRFEAVTLFSCLVMRRLREFGSPGENLAEDLYKRIFSGFDHALREKGTGDSTIARKIRGYGERFFGLSRAVDAAISTSAKGTELLKVLERNGVGGQALNSFVQHLINSEELLTTLDFTSFQSGTIQWPITGGLD